MTLSSRSRVNKFYTIIIGHTLNNSMKYKNPELVTSHYFDEFAHIILMNCSYFAYLDEFDVNAETALDVYQDSENPTTLG